MLYPTWIFYSLTRRPGRGMFYMGRLGVVLPTRVRGTEATGRHPDQAVVSQHSAPRLQGPRRALEVPVRRRVFGIEAPSAW